MTEVKKYLRPKPLVLITLEGWGVARAHSANAITEANPEYFKFLISHYPALTLLASGESVGALLSETVGTELGHLAIGLGRPVINYCTLVDQEIASGNFSKLCETEFADIREGSVHLIGLISTVQVEASLHHLQSLLKSLKESLPLDTKIFLHAILDGRDMSAKGGRHLLEDIEKELKTCNGTIASITGRLYGLDSHEHKARLEKTVTTMVEGKGNTSISALQAVSDNYQKKIFDEELPPTAITSSGDTPVALISKEDTVIFFNFNPISIRPLARSLIQQFSATESHPQCISLVPYDDPEIKPLCILRSQSNFLGECISEAGFRQIRISDSEGYVSITSFLNGGNDVSVSGEDRHLISLSGETEYSTRPELGTTDIAKETVKIIEENKYDFMAVNFSALDRVGHMSNISLAKDVVIAIDRALRKIIEAVLQANGVAVIVGSHGLAEQLISINGEKFSPHTINPVPFILVGKPFAGYSLGFPEAVGGDLSLITPVGSLIDVAPTILKLLKLSVPSVMTGKSFFDELTLL